MKKYFLEIPVISAFIGLLLSVLIISYDGCDKNKVPYTYIFLSNKKEIVTSLISNRIRLLKIQLDTSHPDSRYQKLKEEEDKKLFLEKAIKALSISMTELNRLENFNADTLPKYYTNYLSVDKSVFRDSLEKAFGNTGKNKEVIVPCITVDTCSVLSDTPMIKPANIILKQYRSQTTMGFISNAPLYGFWLVFSIAQMTLWFLIVPLLLGKLFFIQDEVGFSTKFAKVAALKSLLVPAIFIVVFVILLYIFLIDTFIISDDYFLSGYNMKMVFYAIPGYMAAILCFGIYLFLANRLNDHIVKKKAATPATAPILAEQFNNLKQFFDQTFLLTAVILSLFVLWVGIAFNAVNSTEAMKFYFHLSGRQFISFDLVYLLGLIHTLLLLIFYIPAKLKFSSVDMPPSGTQSPPAKNIIGSLFDSIGTVLITASPLIAGVVQKLISSLLS